MPTDTARGTILIVDDEAPLLRLITRVLERDGFTTLTAADGEEAKAQLDEHGDAIDGAILDVFIPPNGIEEVIDHLAANRPDMPMMFSSGDMPTPELGARIEKLGASFLRKPFQPRALVEQVARMVEASAAGGSG